MNEISGLFQQLLDQPVASITIIINLIIIESLLSIDNAAVLATMVMSLPKHQRRRALRYGILGAYIFRGICLLFASILIEIWWFKPLGGMYLLLLAVKHFFFTSPQEEHADVDEAVRHQKKSWLYRKTLGVFGPFWATVILVELMDLAFSIDNVIAANAYTNNILLIWVGVFIGILAMRFVAQGFVKLLEKYPFLTTCAYLVIALLGIKLTLAGLFHFFPCSSFALFIDGPASCLESQGKSLPEGEHPVIWGDIITSILSISIFVLPVIYAKWFSKNKISAES